MGWRSDLQSPSQSQPCLLLNQIYSWAFSGTWFLHRMWCIYHTHRSTTSKTQFLYSLITCHWKFDWCRIKHVPKIGVFIVNPGVSVTRINKFLPFFSVVYDMAVAPFVKTNSQVCFPFCLHDSMQKHEDISSFVSEQDMLCSLVSDICPREET